MSADTDIAAASVWATALREYAEVLSQDETVIYTLSESAAALDRVAARLADTERDRRYIEEGMPDPFDGLPLSDFMLKARAEAGAENESWRKERARAEAAERERDEALRTRFQADNIVVVPENELVAMRLRAELAERRLQEAEKALREILQAIPRIRNTGDPNRLSEVREAHRVLAVLADKEGGG